MNKLAIAALAAAVIPVAALAINEPHWRLVGFAGQGDTTIATVIFLDVANVKPDSKGHVHIWTLVIPFAQMQEVTRDDPRSQLAGPAGLKAFTPMLEEAVIKIEHDPQGMTLDCKTGRAQADGSTAWDNAPANSPITAIERLVCAP
jgi:hypothetical protein